MTPKKKKAHERNFLIFRLRGLYAFSLQLSNTNGQIIQDAVDAELQLLDAETETARRDRARRLIS